MHNQYQRNRPRRGWRRAWFGAVLLGGAIGLTGCQSVSERPDAKADPPTELIVAPADAPVDEDSGAASPPVSPPASPPASPQRVSQPAVVALIDAAERSRASGQLARAAQHLERALRIDPNDALVWHKLAEVRFTQADYGQTLSLCARSNTLLEPDSALRRANHELRVRAFQALGDDAAAERERLLIGS